MRIFHFKMFFLLLGPIQFIIFFLLQPLHASSEINKMAGIVLWMALWWLSECVHLAVTSLLPIVLLPVAQIASVKDVTREYGDSIIFLFLGSFLISIAIEKWNLHKRIARWILSFTGKSANGMLIGVMLSAFLISNWISNTATALMLFSAVLALIKVSQEQLDKNDHHLLAVSLMLGMAYAASIGGIATPVGTSPNMYFYKIYPKILNNTFHISFIEWLYYFLPLSVLILIGCFFILKMLFLNKLKQKKTLLFNEEYLPMQKLSYEEKVISWIFILTVLLWLSRDGWAFGMFRFGGWKSFFKYSEYFDDSVVAIGMSALLFLIPSKKNIHENILEWKDMKHLKYEILLLFGGGFALAYGFEKSGLIRYLVQQLYFLKHIHPLLLIFILSCIVVVISEFASNIASIQLALPIVAAIAQQFPKQFQPMLIFSCVLSASIGFMLPVATAPNTIVFGSGLISMKQFLKAGFWLDLFSIFAISLYCYFIV